MKKLTQWAAERADRLARQASGYADGLRRAAGQRLLAGRAAAGLSARPGPVPPISRVTGGAQPGGQPSSGAARTACASHQASSSS